jgi:ATP-dependent helicase/nuclease subunit B
VAEKTLIAGRAGTGKTTAVLARVAGLIAERREGECLLLLPTQSQVDHLKEILLRSGRGGFQDLFAHTFFTFSRSLFQGLPEALVPEEGRDFLIRLLLESERFPSFASVLEFPGFRRLLGEGLRELRENLVSPDDYARRILAPLDAAGRASPRHRELERAYSAYVRLLRERRRVDPEGMMLAAVGRLETDATLLASRRLLLVDGFHDFTPVELRLLELLSERIPESIFTLSFDPASPGHAAFAASVPARRRLLELGFREMPRAANRRTLDPTLVRLEAALFEGPREAGPAGDSLRILWASREEAEVESIARAILRLVREEGVAWREIAVVFRDLQGVADRAEGTFHRLGIPVRISHPKPLGAQPVVRFLLDLGRVVGGVCDSETMIRLGRSTYAVWLELEEVDRLDVALRENAPPFDPEGWAALALKLDLPGLKRFLKVVSRGRERLAAQRSLPGVARVWRETFLEVALPAGIETARLGETGLRGPEECAAIEAFWRIVEEAAEWTALPERERSAEPRRAPGNAEALLHRLLRGVGEEVREAGFRIRDRRRDAVNLIDAREARQWEASTVFVGGILERRFPPAPVEGLLFDDEDRRCLNASGLRFRDRSWKEDEERFLFYTAVSRARDRLILSYPDSDERGNRALPSFFLREVERIFSPQGLSGRTVRRPASEVLPSPETAADLQEVDRIAMSGLAARHPRPEERKEIRLAAALYGLRREAPSFRERFAGLLSRTPPRLRDPAILAELAAADAALSDSALRSFLQCPYLHFVKKQLRVEALPGREMEPLDLGTLIHDVLKEHFESGGESDFLECLERHFRAAAAAKRVSFRRRAERWQLRRALAAFLPKEAERLRRLGLSPGRFEHDFGTSKSASPAVMLDGEGRGERLSGKIDRIDLLPGGRAGVIVDYKYSSAAGVRKQRDESLGKKGEIKAFQVAIYLLALEEALGLLPAGAELVSLKKRVERFGIGRRDLLRDAGLERDLEEDWELLEESEFRAFLDRARVAMSRLARRIRAGEIDTHPADPEACGPGECDAADICRFDRWVGRTDAEE